MSVYDRDEYENWDEYEEEDGEDFQEVDGEEEYEEEEEVHQPTQEELEYLGLRERLKEVHRRKMKKDSGSAYPDSISSKKFPAKDNFGSFFGPSKPVIAQRVIQESKSLLENPDLASRVFKSNKATNKSSSIPVRSKPRPNASKPMVTNVVKPKVEMLKNIRDYSFLSDDAELPAPANRASQNGFARNSDVRPSKMPQKIREPVRNSGRKFPNGLQDRKDKPSGHQAQSKMVNQKFAAVNKPKQTSADTKKVVPINKSVARLSIEKPVPSKIPVGTLQKKVCTPGANSAIRQVQKPLAMKMQPAVSKRPMLQKREPQESIRSKVVQRPLSSSSKSQTKPPQPRISHRMEDGRLNRKPVRRDEPRKRHNDDDSDDDDGGQALMAIREIRNMFRYNPNKYRDEDDVSDMEANYADIQREEKISAKIGRKEDEEALREIEEEERRERMRREAKKRKLSQR